MEHTPAAVTGDPPLVSVLIPMYNHEGFIGTCLTSVVHDSYPRVEVLVLDDGSRDASFETAQRWREANPSAFERFELSHQENHGSAVTLNRLIRDARGEFVALLASDDYLLRGGLTARVAALQAHPEWLAVFGDCRVVDGEGKTLYESGLREWQCADTVALSHPRTIADDFVWRFTISGPILMVRRSAFAPEVLGPLREPDPGEDLDLFLRLLSLRALGFVDYPVAAWRMHGANTYARRETLRGGRRIAWERLGDFTGTVALGILLRQIEQDLTVKAGHGLHFRLANSLVHRLRKVVMRAVLARNSALARRLTVTRGCAPAPTTRDFSAESQSRARSSR